MNALVVVDMQNDFIDGSLGSSAAQAIVAAAAEKCAGFKGAIVFTRDTHGENYPETQEGRNLPVPHCVKGTHGWQICEALLGYVSVPPVDKPAFGSTELPAVLRSLCGGDPAEITLIGLCTDICVISNAMLLKAAFPETVIRVDGACCAGVSAESHRTALAAMKACQIIVENE